MCEFNKDLLNEWIFKFSAQGRAQCWNVNLGVSSIRMVFKTVGDYQGALCSHSRKGDPDLAVGYLCIYKAE